MPQENKKEEMRISSKEAKQRIYQKQIRKTMLKGNIFLFFVSVLCSLLNAVLNVFVAYLFQIILDAATNHSMDGLT